MAVLRILEEKTDSDHRITMDELIAELDEAGISAERKSVYASIDALKESGHKIVFSRAGGIQGYYIEHMFSLSQAMLICDAAAGSPSLSRKQTAEMISAVNERLSIYQRKAVVPFQVCQTKTDNDHVMQIMELLLKAIAGAHPVEFRYYDLTVSKKKEYRRNSQIYHLNPYAVMSFEGRYYCVLWSEKHRSFANYRIDKMESAKVLEDTFDPLPFDPASWRRTSFHAYRGKAQTVVIRFDLSMANIVFDEFGDDIIISQTDSTSFTASIRTSVTPTLISWLLMFTGRLTVLKPAELISELLATAQTLEKTYNN